MKPGKPLRKSWLKHGTKKRRRSPRPVSEQVRIYGPPERREWTKTLPCRICGVVGYTEAAHVVKGDGGMGYKASAQFTAPLCGLRPKWENKPTPWGCHRELHRIGPEAFEAKYAVSLDAMAVEHDAAFHDYWETSDV